jgi:hypothetical protein
LGQGRQQGLHQGQIHHRHLIHHQQIELQRQSGTAAEPCTVAAGLQQPVQGAAGQPGQALGQAGRQFSGSSGHGGAEAGGRLAGGRRQLQAQLGLQPQGRRQHPHHGGGLAGAGPAAEQHQPLLQQGPHRSALLPIQAGRRRQAPGFLQLAGAGGRFHAGLPPFDQGGGAVAELLVPAAPTQPAAGAHHRRLGLILWHVLRRAGLHQPAAGLQGRQLGGGPGMGLAGGGLAGGVGARGFPTSLLQLRRWRPFQIESQFAPLQGAGQGGDHLPQGELTRRIEPGCAGCRQQAQQAVEQGRGQAAHGWPSRSRASSASSRASGGRSTSTPGTSSPGLAAIGPGTPRRNT